MNLFVIAGIAGLLLLPRRSPKARKSLSRSPSSSLPRYTVGDAEESNGTPAENPDDELRAGAEEVFFVSEETGYPIPMCAALALDTYSNEGGENPDVISAWQNAMGLESTGQYDDITVRMMELAVEILETPPAEAATPTGGEGENASATGGGSTAAQQGGAFTQGAAAIAATSPAAFLPPGTRPSYRPQRRPNRQKPSTSTPGANRRPGANRVPGTSRRPGAYGSGTASGRSSGGGYGPGTSTAPKPPSQRRPREWGRKESSAPPASRRTSPPAGRRRPAKPDRKRR